MVSFLQLHLYAIKLKFQIFILPMHFLHFALFPFTFSLKLAYLMIKILNSSQHVRLLRICIFDLVKFVAKLSFHLLEDVLFLDNGSLGLLKIPCQIIDGHLPLFPACCYLVFIAITLLYYLRLEL